MSNTFKRFFYKNLLEIAYFYLYFVFSVHIYKIFGDYPCKITRIENKHRYAAAATKFFVFCKENTHKQNRHSNDSHNVVEHKSRYPICIEYNRTDKRGRAEYEKNIEDIRADDVAYCKVRFSFFSRG